MKIEENTIKGVFRAFAVAVVKKRNADIGKALEDAFEKTQENGDKGKPNS